MNPLLFSVANRTAIQKDKDIVHTVVEAIFPELGGSSLQHGPSQHDKVDDNRHPNADVDAFFRKDRKGFS